MKGLGLLTGKKAPKELVRDAVECLKVIARDPELTTQKDSKQQKVNISMLMMIMIKNISIHMTIIISSYYKLLNNTPYDYMVAFLSERW